MSRKASRRTSSSSGVSFTGRRSISRRHAWKMLIRGTGHSSRTLRREVSAAGGSRESPPTRTRLREPQPVDVPNAVGRQQQDICRMNEVVEIDRAHAHLTLARRFVRPDSPGYSSQVIDPATDTREGVGQCGRAYQARPDRRRVAARSARVRVARACELRLEQEIRGDEAARAVADDGRDERSVRFVVARRDQGADAEDPQRVRY